MWRSGTFAFRVNRPHSELRVGHMETGKNLIGKSVLVTAGPTWVALDRVRVLTPVFSGETGLWIARSFADQGCQVTLLMGPGRARFTSDDWTRMTVRQFFYYEELDALLRACLGQSSYDVIVHSAAVADYRPKSHFNGKIPSGSQDLRIELSPTPKLIDMIHSEAKSSFLVAFKLEVGKTEDELIRIGWQSLQRHGADLVIANDLEQMSGERHVAFLINPARQVIRVEDRAQLCEELTEMVARHLRNRHEDQPV